MEASAVFIDEAFEIRTHPEGGYGDGWTWGCIAVPISKTAVEIRLAARAPTNLERRATEQALIDRGYTHATWFRADGRSAGPFKMRG